MLHSADPEETREEPFLKYKPLLPAYQYLAGHSRGRNEVKRKQTKQKQNYSSMQLRLGYGHGLSQPPA